MYRIGLGIDVHRFTENRKLYLGGIEIPYKYGLEGHSDADVLIHSIMDAILGALGKPDIGYFFPPNDPKYKNIRSTILLEKIINLMNSEEFEIENLDCTIIAQVPKILPYRDLIIKNLSSLIKIPENKINVKATTTEKMGFLGRKEGIMSISIVLLKTRSFIDEKRKT